MLMRLANILFFFNDTATTEIYTLSLHDALPICQHFIVFVGNGQLGSHTRDTVYLVVDLFALGIVFGLDRKSTRLNSSHGYISYAVFCLKKKNKCIQVSASSAYHIS